jgi:small-conductance mechanosensitive channel
MLKTVRRLWVPLACVVLAGVASLFAPALVGAMGTGTYVRLEQGLGYAFQVALWLAVAFLAIRLLELLLWERVEGLGRAVPRLLKDLVALAILLIAAAGIVGIVFDQSVTGIWATSGAIGIILGLALRTIILDIFSGLAINVDHSYRIGDYVELLDKGLPTIYGRVAEINWRTTRIETDDRRIIVVPNSKMGLTVLANYSMPSEVSRFELLYTLDFAVPPDRAMRVLLAGARAAAGRNGLVPEPLPNVVIGAATPLGIEYRVRFWHRVSVMPPAMARHQVNRSILSHLARAGLSLAYPKQDTFHAAMPARQLEHAAEGDRARLLGAIEIFGKSLNQAELARLAVEMTPRVFAAQSVLIREGDAGATMFVLAEGLVEVHTNAPGRDFTVGRIEPGEFVGEMSLLTGEPRSATVIAVTEVLAYEITYDHFAPILAARPEIAEAMSVSIAERRLRASARLAEAGMPEQAAEFRTFSTQVVQKIRFFFRHVLERHGSHAAQ